ncbi:hypothetical protein Tco_0009587 [Tanacetum coccineum]
MSGRPKGKKKKHPSEVNESNSKKVSRFGRTMTCSNCYRKGHNKTGCTSKKVDPLPNEVRSKGKKGGQSGFESAVSALKRMRMDVNGSGQNEEAHVQEEKNLLMQILDRWNHLLKRKNMFKRKNMPMHTWKNLFKRNNLPMMVLPI